MRRIASLAFAAAVLAWNTGPASASSTLDRGDKCAAVGNFRCALSAYAEEVRVRPGPLPYFQAARVHMARGDYRDAILQFQKAILLLPKGITWRYLESGLAWSYYQQGEAEKALPHVLRAIEHDPTNSRFWHTLGKIVEELPYGGVYNNDISRALTTVVERNGLPEIAAAVREARDTDAHFGIIVLLGKLGVLPPMDWA